MIVPKVGRLLLILLALLILSTAAPVIKGQSGGQTLLTGVVKDPNGNLYTLSQVNLTFYDPGTSGKLPLLNGSTFQTTYTGYGTDGAGNIPPGLSVADNGVIASSSGATGTQWAVNICYNDRMTCFQGKLTINCSANIPATCTSNTIDISAALQAISTPIPGTLNPNQSVCTLNTVKYIGVGGCYPSNFDIGAQANAAYASFPPTGGDIFLVPKSNGACYDYSTPIIFGTLGKPVSLRGLAPSYSSTSVTGGCLNFLPHNGGDVAITLDWSILGPTAFQSNVALADFTLVNNSCTTNFGCGSGAIGVLTGATNFGVFGARFSNFNVYGFGNGWRNAAGNAWGRVWDGGSIAFNTIGVQLNVGNEIDTFIGVKFVVNGIHIAEALTPAEVNLVGGSMDAANTCGVTMANLTFLYASNVHWENNGVQNTRFVCGPSGSAMTLTGGIISDDHNAGGGTNSTHWFEFGHGTVSNVLVEGFNTDYTGGLVFNPIEYAAISGIAVNNSTTISDGILCPVPVRCSLSYSSPQQPAGISWNNNTTTNVLNQGCSPSGGCYAGVSACVASVKTINYGHTYNSLPVVIPVDETTTGGVRITGKNTSQFTVACTGATDVFDWAVIGNPN